MMPSAKIASWRSAPPENRLIREDRPCCSPGVACLRQKLTCSTLTFGVGMMEPKRKIARIASVKKIFLRRSGVRNALANAASTRASLSRDNPGRVTELLARCRVCSSREQDRPTLSRTDQEARIVSVAQSAPRCSLRAWWFRPHARPAAGSINALRQETQLTSPPRRVRARAAVQLHQDAADVHLDRTRAQKQLAGDLPIGPSRGHHPDDLSLAAGQAAVFELRRRPVTSAPEGRRAQ